ncbi:uncharacterized protein LOC110104392 [Dendrobium catenatum]|uniref:Ubiquinol oxidase 4, chloroplastic/chromoplastic n=1 Tax=Dendrobium catenatum TaxID=906689 RepID=A0A2I0X6Z1_9ASPA|nr:uncharacterized protein LOC110104392 [Dendrobium catenatum]PKU83685.1 Ubiquinol oxidase 4, chloroplastic/chromoplastic [Dendrobium catenatum]
MAATVAARSASLFASHSYRTTKAVIIRPFTASSSAPFAYNILLRPTYLSLSGRMLSRKSFQRRAATLQEKEEQVGVEDYFHVKTIPNIVEEPTDDDNSSSKEPGMVEKWVIKFEQSLNVLLTVCFPNISLFADFVDKLVYDISFITPFAFLSIKNLCRPSLYASHVLFVNNCRPLTVGFNSAPIFIYLFNS